MLAKHSTMLITVSYLEFCWRICPLYCRLLLNMYGNQNLRVRWESTHSSYFNVSNGVKQGGVISPSYFVYTLMVC